MTKALIIIDMWDTYHNGFARFDPIIENTVLRIANLIGNWDGPIILACYQTYRIDSTNNWKEDNMMPWTCPNLILELAVNDHSGPSIVSWDTTEILNLLEKYNVSEIYYAGQSLPGCVEEREIGIANIPSKFTSYILADCTIHIYSLGRNTQDILHDNYGYIINRYKDKISHSSLFIPVVFHK